MTPGLRLVFCDQPLERLHADLVIVGIAEEDRPLRASAGRVDWRLCGHLSRFLASGRLSGARGEAALIGVAGGLRAPMVLALGLGSRAALGRRVWEELGAEALSRALRLGVETCALGLCDEDSGLDVSGEAPPADRVSMVAGAVRALREAALDDDIGVRSVELVILGPPPDAEERIALERLLPGAVEAPRPASPPRGLASSQESSAPSPAPVKLPPRSPIL